MTTVQETLNVSSGAVTFSPSLSANLLMLQSTTAWMSGNWPSVNANGLNGSDKAGTDVEMLSENISATGSASSSSFSLEDEGLAINYLCNEDGGDGTSGGAGGDGGDGSKLAPRDPALYFPSEGEVPEVEAYHCLSDIHFGAPLMHSSIRFYFCNPILRFDFNPIQFIIGDVFEGWHAQSTKHMKVLTLES